MLAVTTTLPDAANGRPPIILVHGAASSSGIWRYWQARLAKQGYASYALDLRGHGQSTPCDLSRTSMHDYAADVRTLSSQLERKPVLLGWSMGGLVSMMAAAAGDAVACVCLAPSTPARAVDTSVTLREGVFGPEEYGITNLTAAEQPAMPDLDDEEREVALAALANESRRARDERKAGIVVESMPCPLLIVTGTNDDQWPRERYEGLWLEADHVEVEGASHWGLVLSRRALAHAAPAVAGWLAQPRIATSTQ